MLPAYDQPVPDEVGFAHPGPYNEWFAQKYGCNVTRRYCVDLAESVLCALECSSAPRDLPPTARWAAMDDLADLVWADSESLAVVEAAVANDGVSVSMPWSHDGGCGPAVAWLYERLRERGVTPLGRMEQVKCAYVSAVFRCPTDRGDVYLKLLPRVFVRETAILLYLAERGITPLPQVLAINHGKGWLATWDMGGANLAPGDPPELWGQAIDLLAQVQSRSIAHVRDVSRAPLYDLRPAAMAGALEKLIPRAVRALEGSPHALRPDECTALEAALPRWRRLCEALDASPIPCALEHGDLRPGNIRVTPRGLVLYDWAWSAVAHPFLSLATLLHNARSTHPVAVDAKERVRDRYLSAWTAFAPVAELRAEYERVDELKTLYAALSDLTWVEELLNALDRVVPAPFSADAWALDRRRFYLAKVLRRLA